MYQHCQNPFTIKQWQKSVDLSPKPCFWASKQLFAIHFLLATCNVCPLTIPEFFAQTQVSDYSQLIYSGDSAHPVSLYSLHLWCMPEMVAPRALVFQPVVKGNEDSGNEIEWRTTKKILPPTSSPGPSPLRFITTASEQTVQYELRQFSETYCVYIKLKNALIY